MNDTGSPQREMIPWDTTRRNILLALRRIELPVLAFVLCFPTTVRVNKSIQVIQELHDLFGSECLKNIVFHFPNGICEESVCDCTNKIQQSLNELGHNCIFPAFSTSRMEPCDIVKSKFDYITEAVVPFHITWKDQVCAKCGETTDPRVATKNCHPVPVRQHVLEPKLHDLCANYHDCGCHKTGEDKPFIGGAPLHRRYWRTGCGVPFTEAERAPRAGTGCVVKCNHCNQVWKVSPGSRNVPNPVCYQWCKRCTQKIAENQPCCIPWCSNCNNSLPRKACGAFDHDFSK
jgi:hypothetical protein